MHESKDYSTSDDDDDSYLFQASISESKNRRTSDRNLIIDIKEVESTSEVEKIRIQEKEILCIFELPDGSEGEKLFKLGQTVEYLKSFVESEFGIPMNAQVMYLRYGCINYETTLIID